MEGAKLPGEAEGGSVDEKLVLVWIGGAVDGAPWRRVHTDEFGDGDGNFAVIYARGRDGEKVGGVVGGTPWRGVGIISSVLRCGVDVGVDLIGREEGGAAGLFLKMGSVKIDFW